MRENNWEYALDCAGGNRNFYASQAGESYLSFWEHGIGLSSDRTVVPVWRDQKDLAARKPSVVAAELGVHYSMSTAPEAEQALDVDETSGDALRVLWRAKRQLPRTVQSRFAGCLLGRTATLELLDACRRQVETRAQAERAITAAGYQCNGFLWNRDLELYLDIQDEFVEVAFLAKGWGDPGFRLGQIVRLPPDIEADNESVERLRRFCTLNGMVVTVGPKPDGIEVVMEYLIYSAGFNAESLSAALDILGECTAAASPVMLEMD